MRSANLVIFTALMFGACSSSGVDFPSQTTLPRPDRTQVDPVSQVRIEPRDRVEVRVFGVKELSGTFDVDRSGAVKLPLIGAIDASGKTAIEFASSVEQALEVEYMQNADVSVLVEPNAVRLVTLDGAVNKPGVYEIEGRTSLLKAIARGGGTDSDANTSRVVVFREINGQRMAAGFDLGKIRDGVADDPEIYGNDIIVVADSGARRAYGSIVESIPLLGLYVQADAGVKRGAP